MSTVKVIVCGALGRVGREMVAGIAADPSLEVVGGVDVKATTGVLEVRGHQVPLTRDLETMLQTAKEKRPLVMVDFTHPDAVLDNVRTAIRHGVFPVIGTTGIPAAGIEEIARLAEAAGLGAVVAPNFAIGAVLMMHFARLAARYFPSAEIIELHHDGKADAPSGTALATARLMREARSEAFVSAPTHKITLEDVRGGEEGGVRIHSVRLPGLVAHQEVILGGPGQTLSIRHDTIGRDCYVPGVVLAIKEVVQRRGLVYGLDKLMGLQ